MKFTRSAKATALLLLVSFQYTFAALDIALCSSALCYPKVSGAKVGQVIKKCPDGFSLEGDSCVKRVPKGCSGGFTAQGGKCCAQALVNATSCMPAPSWGCPAGFTSKKDCGQLSFDLAANKTGRRLQSFGGDALVKELNIIGHSVVPNVILPKPAFSVNIAKPTKKADQPKININGHHGMPQIILPEPKVSFTVPEMPHVGPKINFEGHPSIMPNIIPVLPEPLVTVEVPKGGYGSHVPKVNVEHSQKKVTIDLSQLGPKHTVDLNLPAMPDLLHEVNKIPDIEVNMPDTPKVIDLSALGPKKTYNITLPQVKLPKQGSLTIINNGAHEPQYLDLSHLGPKHRTGLNIKLPNIETHGATVNVIVDEDKSLKDTIVIPGHKEKHNTVINVPGHEKDAVEKRSKLVIDVATNPKLHGALEALQKKVQVEKVNIKMPDIDLSKHLPAGHDVVVELKPLVKFEHSMKDKPTVTNIDKRIDVEMHNITIPKLMDDKTFVIKPIPAASIAKHLLPKHLYQALEAANADNTTETLITKTTVINMPENTLPRIPVPKDKIDTSVSIPIRLNHAGNGSEPDATISMSYKEEWKGGNPILPHPIGHVIKKAEKAADLLMAAKCIPMCCQEGAGETCVDAEVEVQTVAPELSCEAGFSLDANSGTCTSGDVKVDECPSGMSKCSIGNKGVCVPSVEGKIGHDACLVFKTLCHKGTIVAKSCNM